MDDGCGVIVMLVVITFVAVFGTYILADEDNQKLVRRGVMIERCVAQHNGTWNDEVVRLKDTTGKVISTNCITTKGGILVDSVVRRIPE